MTTFFRTVPAEEATGKLKELYDEDIRLHGRVLGAGQVLLVEDTAGKGHQSKSLEGPPVRQIFVTIN
jgi:hypothetical protein